MGAYRPMKASILRWWVIEFRMGRRNSTDLPLRNPESIYGERGAIIFITDAEYRTRIMDP